MSALTRSAHGLSVEVDARRWMRRGLCRNGDPDALFVAGAAQNIAKKVCQRCPVQLECAGYALDNNIEFGVWGGLTERQRRLLRRRHSRVRDWSGWLRRAAGRWAP